MNEWLAEFWETLTWPNVLIGIGLFLAMFALSIFEVGVILVLLPADYFRGERKSWFRNHHPAVSVIGVVLKNLLGVIHVAIGVILSLPGVPGQGLLTILIGVMLLDLPGVRRMEKALVRRPSVITAINRIRAKFKRQPLVLDGETAVSESAAGQG